MCRILPECRECTIEVSKHYPGIDVDASLDELEPQRLLVRSGHGRVPQEVEKGGALVVGPLNVRAILQQQLNNLGSFWVSQKEFRRDGPHR